MKVATGLVCLLVVLCVSCGEKEKTQAFNTRPQIAPITDQGLDAVKARVKKATDYLLTYAKKHGRFPELRTSGIGSELRDILRPEFGHEPGYEEVWVSHTGKNWLFFNPGLSGKSLSEISDPDGTWLLKDPVRVGPHGNVVSYVSGRIDTVIERPVPAG